MKSVTSDEVKGNLELLIDEITQIHEPVRIQGKNKRSVVVIDAADFENLLEKTSTSRTKVGEGRAPEGQGSAKRLFGMLRHRAPDIPVTLEQMEIAIENRRSERACK